MGFELGRVLPTVDIVEVESARAIRKVLAGRLGFEPSPARSLCRSATPEGECEPMTIGEGGGPANLHPVSDGHSLNAIGISYLGRTSLGRRAICSPLESIRGATVCAQEAQISGFEPGFWRRRPDLNPGMEVLQTVQGCDS